MDAYEFSTLLNDQLTAAEISGKPINTSTNPAAPDNFSLVEHTSVVEYKPHFHEWATVQPGENTFHLSNVS